MRFGFLLACLFAATPAEAYVRTLTESGRPLVWANPNLSVLGNPSNRSGLSHADVASAFGGALNAWSSVSGTSARISYSQSTGYGAGSGRDGANLAYFASTAGRQIGYGVVAVTEVLYYVASGQVLEADMAFNDYNFLFTNREGDTGQAINGAIAIYLRDVATHEAGHVLGFDHSSVNLSSMIYTAFSGQLALTGDDQSAVLTAFPAGGARGAIRGTVKGRNGGVFGAHVVAINLGTGLAQAGALAEPDGSFRIGDLPPGSYAVMGEPYGSSAGNLSSYYASVNHRFCPSGARFRRMFYGRCGTGQASVLQVNSGSTLEIGTLAPTCSQMGNGGPAPLTLPSARELPSAGGALAGTISPGETHYYRVRGVAGDLVARAMAFSLYSPVDLQVEILSSNLTDIGATNLADVSPSLPGGKTNFDAESRASVSSGDYIIRVRAGANRVPSTAYSAGFELLDRDGHYLLALSVNESFNPAGPTDMSACVGLNNVVQNANTRAPASSRDSDESGGCGSLGPSGPGGGGGGGLGTWLLVLALAHALPLGRRLVRRFA